MKRFYWILLLCSLTGFATAQHKFEIKGDKKKGNFSYVKAIADYQKALDHHAIPANRIKLKIAECFRMLNKPQKAVRWYSEIMHDETLIQPLHKLYYAQALCCFGDYTEAKKWFEAYSKDNPADKRPGNFLQFIDQIGDLSDQKAGFYIDELAINSPASDFPADWYGEQGIIIISGRDGKKSNRGNPTSFDIYVSFSDTAGSLRKPVRPEGSVNTKANEGSAAMIADGPTMIYSRDLYLRHANLARGRMRHSQLFFGAGEDRGEKLRWDQTASFSLNNRDYSCNHPSVSSDGKILYFISDMPGGFGGADIYRSVHNGVTWGTPENLGSAVNTEGDELFPFISEDDQLFFASNGRGGFGGLDVFVTRQEGREFKPAENLGRPINSRCDDFALIIKKTGRWGYFSSNREGNDDIYRFDAIRDGIQ